MGDHSLIDEVQAAAGFVAILETIRLRRKKHISEECRIMKPVLLVGMQAVSSVAYLQSPGRSSSLRFGVC